jgi:hypothetical protein
VIEGQFEDAERTKAVGFSHCNFGLVVQAFHGPAGDRLLRPKVIENELPVLAEAGVLINKSSEVVAAV